MGQVWRLFRFQASPASSLYLKMILFFQRLPTLTPPTASRDKFKFRSDLFENERKMLQNGKPTFQGDSNTWFSLT